MVQIREQMCLLWSLSDLSWVFANSVAVRSVCASGRDGEDVMSNAVMHLSQRMHEWHWRTGGGGGKVTNVDTQPAFIVQFHSW